jgi:ribosome-binding factor A
LEKKDMLAGKRATKVGDQILKCVAGLLMQKIRDPRVNGVTLTGVQVSNDLKNAVIFFSLIGNEDDIKRAKAGLDSAKGFIKREIALYVKLRNTPDIFFKYDPTLETGNRLERLFQEIKRSDSTENIE